MTILTILLLLLHRCLLISHLLQQRCPSKSKHSVELIALSRNQNAAVKPANTFLQELCCQYQHLSTLQRLVVVLRT